MLSDKTLAPYSKNKAKQIDKEDTEGWYCLISSRLENTFLLFISDDSHTSAWNFNLVIYPFIQQSFRIAYFVLTLS